MHLNITKEEYAKRLDVLPDDLQDALFGVATQDIVDKIIKKYPLLNSQAQVLRDDIAYTLQGYVHPDTLRDWLIKDLGVSMVVAAAIVGDLNHEIFIPHKKSITEVLLTYPPKKEWLEVKAPGMPSPTLKPIAPVSPRVAQPTPQIPISKSQTINIPPTQPTQGTRYNTQDTKPIARPITPPPLQTARPLGSRPSILEVQRGTDGIRRAPPKNESTAFVSEQAQAPTPQAPNNSYQISNPTTQPSTSQAPAPQAPINRYTAPAAKSEILNPKPETNTNIQIPKTQALPTTEPVAPIPDIKTNQTPHVMFKYTHPEPPTVAKSEIRNPKSETNTNIQNNKPTPSIPDTKFQIPDTKNQDTFHKTEEAHKNALPAEHAVMDLEEYRANQSGNMLNLKEQ